MKKIYVVNGPNLDMLGVREPKVYGADTLESIEKATREEAKNCGYEIVFSQSNCEGKIVETLHEAYEKAAAVIINAGAFTHYSYAIADAVKMLGCPVVELHISNIFAREEFRHKSVISPYASAVICGAGAYGYELAVKAAANMLREG